MKSLSGLSLIAYQKAKSTQDAYAIGIISEVERKFIREVWQRLQMRKKQHFIQLCELYCAFYMMPHFGLFPPLDRLRVVYGLCPTDLSDLPTWKVIQWAACEVTFGHFHTPEDAVERIRNELPWEHQHGRCLNYTMEAFEGALAKNCPGMKGNVHDWHEVFKHVPRKILLYESFFG